MFKRVLSLCVALVLVVAERRRVICLLQKRIFRLRSFFPPLIRLPKSGIRCASTSCPWLVTADILMSLQHSD